MKYTVVVQYNAVVHVVVDAESEDEAIERAEIESESLTADGSNFEFKDITGACVTNVQ